MRSSWPRAAVVLAAVTIPAVVLAGCSEKTPGTASAGSAETPAATSGKTSGSTTPSSTSKTPVSRPKKIDLKGVDPCTLLTEAQRLQFGLDRPPQPGKTTTLDNAPTCTISKEDRLYFASVIMASTVGVEYYTDGRFAVDATAVQVGGFPSVLGRPKSGQTSCFLGVDVSDGQHLGIQVTSGGETGLDALCELTPRIADAAVATLSNR